MVDQERTKMHFGLIPGLEQLPLEQNAILPEITPARHRMPENRSERVVPSGSIILSGQTKKSVASSRDFRDFRTVQQASTGQVPQGDWGGFSQPPWAGGHAGEMPVAPRPRKGDSPPLWFDASQNASQTKSRPFYGRYVGPIGKAAFTDEPPVTYVDMAAWYHDHEYAALYQYYGYQDPKGWGWPAPWEFTDRRPEFQLDLARADFRLTENVWGFMSEGLDSGFYEGWPGVAHFAGDLFWANAVTESHYGLGQLRLVGYGTMAIGSDLWDMFSGNISVGDFLGNTLRTAENIVVTQIYAAWGLARGGSSFGVSLVKAAPRMVERGLGIGGGTAEEQIAMAVLGGPAGTLLGAAGQALGCFISTAAAQSLPPAMADEMLWNLREFRDGYLRTCSGGSTVVSEYYLVAPKIVRAVARRPDAERIWRYITANYLVSAIAAIRANRPWLAYRRYVQMVRHLGALARRDEGGIIDRWHSYTLNGKPI